MTHLTIDFAPVRRDGTLVLERRGNILVANGETYDLAALAAESPETPGEGWVQAVRVTDAGLAALVLLPHGRMRPRRCAFRSRSRWRRTERSRVPG